MGNERYRDGNATDREGCMVVWRYRVRMRRHVGVTAGGQCVRIRIVRKWGEIGDVVTDRGTGPGAGAPLPTLVVG